MGYCNDQTAFYMVGGGGPISAFNSEVYRYDPAADMWVSGTASTGITPQCWATAALAAPSPGQSFVYLLNGATATGPLVPDVQTVNAFDGSIGPSYANSTPASAAGVAVWNNLLYAFGGQLASGAYTNAMRRYNPATNTWATLAPMPEAKATCGAAINGKIYAVGGSNGLLNSNRIDAYDPATNTWQALGTLPATVSNQAVAVQGDWLWLVGDFTNQSYLAAYNTRTGQLSNFTSNIPPRRNAAAVVYNNRLYVWGGNTTSAITSTLGDMWSADVSTILLATGTAAVPVPGLQAYPNPSVAGTTTLSLPFNTRTVEVFDALGRRVMRQEPAAGAVNLPLDLQARPAGIYLVRAHTAQGRTASCRVVRE